MVHKAEISPPILPLPNRGGNPVDRDQLTVLQLLVILGLMAAVGITALATHPEWFEDNNSVERQVDRF